MANNKKVFTIEIDGVVQSYENVCLLKDGLVDLEATLTNSGFGQSLSAIFGSMEGLSTVLKGFAVGVESLAENAGEIEALTKNVEALRNSLVEEAAMERRLSRQREADWERMSAVYETMMEATSQYRACISETFGLLSDVYAEDAENYRAEAEKVKASINEIDQRLAESTGRKKALLDEEKTASDGRAMVVQEQLAREMESNQQLAQQKAELAKEEERLRKEAETREKRSKRLEIVNGIVTATADVAMGVSKALSMGLLGIPIAALIAAQGAIQVALIKKQLDKVNMEDGGLLHGKRHAQGGMRIEGTNIEVEGDEFVVNRISTRKNLGLIDYINQSRSQLSPADIEAYYARSGQLPAAGRRVKSMYEEGGRLTNLNVVGNTASPAVEDRLLEAIERINFRPVVSVVDITNAQRSVAQVKDMAGA
ncbi:hypothetical protein [Viscerimonas tarda]